MMLRNMFIDLHQQILTTSENALIVCFFVSEIISFDTLKIYIVNSINN